MVGLSVSEKTKDTVLNFMVVGSLLLLVFGASKPDARYVSQPQEGSGISVAKVMPLEFQAVQQLEELTPLVVNTSAPNTNTSQNTSAAANSTNTQATQVLISGQTPEPALSAKKSRNTLKNNLSSVNKALNDTLKNTKLRLF